MNENTKQEEVEEKQAAEAVSNPQSGEVAESELEQLSGGGGPSKPNTGRAF